MKTLALLILLCAGVLAAQTTHSVSLTWQDTLNPSGTTYSVYRATGLCSGTPTFSKIATALTVKTYQDTTVQPGNYCYQVTATANAVESAPSNTALAPVPSFAPAQLSITVQ
jgi:fibronectin type 3 domain-containing protein